MTRRVHDDDQDGGRLVGYARVSTKEQNVEMQLNALRRAGVEEHLLFSESASGVKKGRPALKNALRACAPGDTLVVWKLDRVARSMLTLLELVEDLDKNKIKFRSLTEGFDVSTISGRLVMGMLAALAEFERSLIRERTQSGVDDARARGVKFGARKRVSDAAIEKAHARVFKKGETRVAVAKSLGITTHQLARRFHERDEFIAAKAKPVRKRRAVKKVGAKKTTTTKRGGAKR